MRAEDWLIAKCHSWDDFAREVKTLGTTKQRGDVFERLTQLYLQVDPTYKSRLRRVWLLQSSEMWTKGLLV